MDSNIHWRFIKGIYFTVAMAWSHIAYVLHSALAVIIVIQPTRTQPLSIITNFQAMPSNILLAVRNVDLFIIAMVQHIQY